MECSLLLCLDLSRPNKYLSRPNRRNFILVKLKFQLSYLAVLVETENCAFVSGRLLNVYLTKNICRRLKPEILPFDRNLKELKTIQN